MNGFAFRAHPFTVIAVVFASTLIAFLLPGMTAPMVFYPAIALLVAAGGTARAVYRAVLVVLPLWLFLFVLHGLLGPAPGIAIGGVTISRAGALEALAQGCRLGAVVTVSLALYQTFRPARLLDAVVQRGGSFHLAYLLVATLDAAPRLVRKAGTILAAQRTRGLRLRGNPIRRVGAIVPLTLPLILGALAEVDERAIALDVRGADIAVHRTPLDPPADTLADRIVRWAALAAVPAVLLLRLRG